MKRSICFLLALCLLLCGCAIEFAPPIWPTAAGAQEDSGLRVHFLDVGQADCALLSCDGEYMLIDGGNVDDGRMVVSYLLRQGVSQLNTVICTHAHENHVGGLPAVLAVFHDEDCTSLPGKKNRVYSDSFQEAIDAGYTPCGSCLG